MASFVERHPVWGPVSRSIDDRLRVARDNPSPKTLAAVSHVYPSPCPMWLRRILHARHRTAACGEEGQGCRSR